MLVRPMIGGWEPPRIESISALESRRLAVLPVPGLSGDLHQDLGRGALAVEIVGSLNGDESRDQFLAEIRERFLAGEPVDFVADIVGESELEQVLIETLATEEVASSPDRFRYRIVLREYTEPPEPPSPGLDLGLELDLDLEALLGLDLLDLPSMLTDLPEIGNVLEPIQPAAEALESALSNAGTLLDPIRELFD